jgi:aryl-alcohol dehydrogenase-like predicted oxidoreductase
MHMCNHSAEQLIAGIESNLRRLQTDYIDIMQSHTPEEEIFPYCQEHSIGVIDRGALAMGILTGKFTAETQFAEGDFRQNWQTDSQQRAIFLDDLENVERLRALANGRTLAQLAVQFVLAHPALSTVIPGAKSARQIQETVHAGQLPPLTTDELSQIAAITPPAGGRKIWLA